MVPGLDGPALEPVLSSIILRYSALVPVKNLSVPSNTPFNVAHDLFLRRILQNDHLRQYPPSESYQKSFWKWALYQLENLSRNDEDDEIDECIYAHYLSLRSENCSETPSNSFVTHYLKFPETRGYPTEEDRYETITLLESRTTIEAGTTGLRTWRASLVLAQYLIEHPYLVDTSSVLELGCGTGLICILVASLHVRAASPHSTSELPCVYTTDVDSTVLTRCKNNVMMPCNKSSCYPNIHYKSLDWLDSLSSPNSFVSLFNEAKSNVVLGADVVFDPRLVPPLVETIYLALSSEHTRWAFIALTVRNEATLIHFLCEIGKVLTAEEVSRGQDTAGDILLQIPDQVDGGLEVKIFKVTRKTGA